MKSARFSLFFQVFLFCLPWAIRRRMLCSFLGFKISSSAKIGFSLVVAGDVDLDEDARIGHLTLIKGLAELRLSRGGRIGNLNWITGLPVVAGSKHFSHVEGRAPCLTLGEQSAITNRHLIDCTDSVRIGAFSTLAGFGSQVLTHSIDLKLGRQSSAPVVIADYCFVGTRSVLLPGAVLPPFSVLAAGAVLTERKDESWSVYGGVPARKVADVSSDSAYFKRKRGFVD